MNTIIAEYDISIFCMEIDADYSDHYCKCEDYICRCAKITNARVSELSSSMLPYIKIYEKSNKKYSRKVQVKPTLIEQYCIDRLMHIHGCYETYNYDVIVGSGYYGDELQRVEFANENQLLQDVIKLFTACNTDLEQIKFVLNLEYATVPNFDRLNSIEIKSINVDDLIQMDERLSIIKRSKPNISVQFDTSLPEAVFINNKLVDGYGRLSHAISSNMSKVKVIKLTSDA